MNGISSNHISVRSTDHGNSSFNQCTDQYDVKVSNVKNVTFKTTSILSVNNDRGNKEVESNTSVYNNVHFHTLHNMSDRKLNNSVCFQCDRTDISPQGGGVLHSQSCYSMAHTQGQVAYCDKVDFLFTDMSNHCIRLGALVFLHGCNGNQSKRGFYYLTGDGSLVECKALPSGILQVRLSQ